MPIIVYFHGKDCAEQCETPKELYDFLTSFESIGIYSKPKNKIFAFKPENNKDTKIFYIETNFPVGKMRSEHYATDNRKNLWKINNYITYTKVLINKIFIFSHGLIIFLKTGCNNPFGHILRPSSVEKMLLEDSPI